MLLKINIGKSMNLVKYDACIYTHSIQYHADIKVVF